MVCKFLLKKTVRRPKASINEELTREFYPTGIDKLKWRKPYARFKDAADLPEMGHYLLTIKVLNIYCVW